MTPEISVRLPCVFAALAVLAAGCATPRPEPTPPAAPPPPLKARSLACRAKAKQGVALPIPASGDRAALEAAARDYVRQCGLAEAVELTQALIAFPTVRAEQPAATGAAFVGMAKFLDDWAKSAGVKFEAIDGNEVWELNLGEGPVGVAFLAHGDVVPVGEGWKHQPFEGVIEGEQLFGRGAEDDKGPIASAMVVMRTLAALGIAPRERLQIIIGTGEEHEWAGMVKYAQKTPKPRHVISLDASFPAVVAENGFVAWQLTSKVEPPGKGDRCASVTSIDAGSFLTQVPGEATLVLRPGKGETPAQLQKRLDKAAAEQGAAGSKFRVEVAPVEGGVQVKAHGVSVHSSVADEGHNPLWPLSKVAVAANVCPTGAGRLLRVVAGKFAGDHYGEKLGLAHQHEVMGKLLVTPTMFKLEKERASLSINMRRPAGLTKAQFEEKLAQALEALRKEYGPIEEEPKGRFVGDPHIADTSGTLVPVLTQVYAELTGDKTSKPISIRGGTYARLFPGAVSFGPAPPGAPYRGHAPDESIDLSSLDLLTRAILEATLRLDAATTSR